MSFKVKATVPGYYDNKRVKEGKVFFINDPRDFSEFWMKNLDPKLPQAITDMKNADKAKRLAAKGKKESAAPKASVPKVPVAPAIQAPVKVVDEKPLAHDEDAEVDDEGNPVEVPEEHAEVNESEKDVEIPLNKSDDESPL